MGTKSSVNSIFVGGVRLASSGATAGGGKDIPSMYGVPLVRRRQHVWCVSGTPSPACLVCLWHAFRRVQGTLDALPKGRTIPLRHKIRVQFGKPLEFHDYMPQASPDSAAPQDEGASTSAAAFTGASTSAATPASAPSAATGPSEARGSGAGQGVSSQAGNSVDTVDVERRLRREAQKRFAEDVRASVLGMLGGYGQDRPEEPEGAAHHTPALAQRLGGGKWNLIGWLLYWLPMSACLTVAVVLAASQVHLNGAGMGVAGRLGMGGGYAAAAGVFAGLQGACLNAKVFITLGIVCVAFYLRDFIQWLWPYVVLDCRED